MSRTRATLPDRLKIERGVPWRYFWGWRGPRDGRYYKRKLSKARRQAWKTELRTGIPRERSRRHWERECNWKGW